MAAGASSEAPKRDPKTGHYEDAEHLRAGVRLTANRDAEHWPGFLTQPRAAARRLRQLASLHRKWRAEGNSRWAL